MKEEKQIEEIANILLETSRQNSNNRNNNTAYTAFDAEIIFKYGCDRLNGATALYNAGYRRASDVAREIFEELEMCIGYCTTLLPLNVGLIDLNKIAELKKKYESEGEK